MNVNSVSCCASPLSPPLLLTFLYMYNVSNLCLLRPKLRLSAQLSPLSEAQTPRPFRLATQRSECLVQRYAGFCCFKSIFWTLIQADMSSAQLALVTGASGYLGTEAVLAFKAAGFRVRGTVRQPSQVSSPSIPDIF